MSSSDEAPDVLERTDAGWDVTVGESGLVIGSIRHDRDGYHPRDAQNLPLGTVSTLDEAVSVITEDRALR